VVYGHPYETVQAKAQKLKVERFFQGEQSAETAALLAKVDYVLYGPREREIGRNAALASLRAAYENASVVIYLARR
jgi:hypothetical protein